MFGPPGCGRDSYALLQQAAASYQEGQVECSLTKLAVHEGSTLERTEPDYRHCGPPEYAPSLSMGGDTLGLDVSSLSRASLEHPANQQQGEW